MSWQERIERYKQEQAQLQREGEGKIKEDREKERQRRVEQIKPLLRVLEGLRCRELLTQIRDEIWRLGEVTVLPDLSSVTHETPIEARAVLTAKWPYLGGDYTKSGPISEEQTVWEEKEKMHIETLAIEISWDKGKMSMRRNGRYDYGSPSLGGRVRKIDVDENNSTWLERFLAEDCLYRQTGDPFFLSDHFLFHMTRSPERTQKS